MASDTNTPRSSLGGPQGEGGKGILSAGRRGDGATIGVGGWMGVICRDDDGDILKWPVFGWLNVSRPATAEDGRMKKEEYEDDSNGVGESPRVRCSTGSRKNARAGGRW